MISNSKHELVKHLEDNTNHIIIVADRFILEKRIGKGA